MAGRSASTMSPPETPLPDPRRRSSRSMYSAQRLATLLPLVVPQSRTVAETADWWSSVGQRNGVLHRPR